MDCQPRLTIMSVRQTSMSGETRMFLMAPHLTKSHEKPFKMFTFDRPVIKIDK